MAELRYKCTLLHRTLTTVTRFATLYGRTIEEATRDIDEAVDELRFTITERRIDQLREVLNPAGMGIEQGAVGKRKYVRKTTVVQPPVTPDADIPVLVPPTPPRDSDGFEQPTEMHGLIVPIGTFLNSGGYVYRIMKIRNAQDITIQQHNATTLKPMTYVGNTSIKSTNQSLLRKEWTLVNPTPEFEAIVKNYTNVVLAKDIKRYDAYKNGDNRIMGQASYMLELEGSRIPFTPGFTGNCQLTVIGCMNILLARSTNVPKQLKEIYQLANRQLLLCDIKARLVKSLEEKIPASWIHQKTPYKSSNNSDMVLCLINISK